MDASGAVIMWAEEGGGVEGCPLTLALLAAGALHVGRRRACWALWGGAGDGLALHRAVLVETGQKQDVKQWLMKQKAGNGDAETWSARLVLLRSSLLLFGRRRRARE